MKLSLIASIGILPGLATTSLSQDIWLLLAYAEWQHVEPISYWLTRAALLVPLVWLWKRTRTA